MLVIATSQAGEYTADFTTDDGRWLGGEISDGLLLVEDDTAELALENLETLSGTLTLRMASEGSAQITAGAAWLAEYIDGGGISLGDESLPFPYGHRQWIPDDAPVLAPDKDYWDGSHTNHCDVHYDESTKLFYLYWTGSMADGYPYRQIAVATSADGETWSPYEGNPILTIDYGDGLEGIHVHMPSVLVDSDGLWHMYYSCYQNNIGNRICHATSTDGLSWERRGVLLDRGEDGTFDAGSLRSPEALIGQDGLWHIFYNGTDPKEHYGPTGYATSKDGETWTKYGAITADKTALQYGGMLETPYGVEQWYNCYDVFCYAHADPDDLTSWTIESGAVLEKGWADWNDGYIQAPSPWLLGTTYHMWFNAYSYSTDQEVITHAETAPLFGEGFVLSVEWDGETLSMQLDDGPVLGTSVKEISALSLQATGRLEVDSISLSWTEAAETYDTDDSDGTDDTADDTASSPASDCGCQGNAAVLPFLLLVTGLRARSMRAPLTQRGPRGRWSRRPHEVPSVPDQRGGP